MPLSDGHAAADALLRKLLIRIEENPSRKNRVIERLPEQSWLAEERSALYGRLAAARDALCIELEWGKHENRHNIERVILADAPRLYEFLGLKTPAQIAEEAGQELARLLPVLEGELRPVLDAVVQGWKRSRNLIRDTGPDDTSVAAMAFKAAQCLIKGGLEGMGYRTFSRRATGNSKFLESNYGKVADVIRSIREFPDHYDSENVIESFGLKKIPPACLVSGPLSYRGAQLPTYPYIGLPPEMVTDIGVAGPARWILMVENLESFNRQVREANAPDAITIFTGGFPSDSTLEAILRLARSTDCPIYHWGDIDVGGIKIAHRIDHALATTNKSLSLHLMSPLIARERGLPAQPEKIFKEVLPRSAEIAELADFLASSDAHFLEQEELNPILPGTSGPGSGFF